ncbi:hypothetical protein J2Y67_003196 [Neobacillus niacini]|nr:hypothetical protein [Neobacillus niacini]
MSFIKPMKDKKHEGSKRNVHHKTDEGQKA